MRFILVLLFAIAAPPAATGVATQTAASPSPSKAAILAAARTVIGKARYATFTTLDQRGAPQSRIVDPFPPEDEMTIWVATNSRSRKVEQIAGDGRVSITYFDREAEQYATVIGTATLVRDLTARAARWKEEWAPFYQNGYRGDDYVLIRIVPTRLELVAPALGMANDPATWRPVVLELQPPQ